MDQAAVRIGIVGAGANTKLRHIPGFAALPGVEIVGVVNSCAASTAKVAEQFQIPRQFTSWQELVADPGIDAVVIGTWPDLHAEITIAALKGGKHVLTEARMAADLPAAKEMHAAALAHPKLIAQLVPSPFGLECGPAVMQLMQHGYLGTLREVVVIGADDSFWDYSKPLHPRQIAEKSGINTHLLGILHETLLRWIPAPTRVFAQRTLFEPERPIPEQCRNEQVTVPDSVQVLTEIEGGARGIYHISCITLFGPGKQIHLYGSRGTIKVEFRPDGEYLSMAHAGDAEPKVMQAPEDIRGSWTVERDFVQSIREGRLIGNTSFAEGVRYMEFTAAVVDSATQNQPVSLS
ncbi:MAG: Gfo/Idh/MocA family oxidoreductase [Planctomycetaceae bacterium]